MRYQLCNTSSFLLREIEFHVRSMPIIFIDILVTFGIWQAVHQREFLVCYEFYVLNQARYFQETMETVIVSQKTRNQLPNSPSYDYNTHL